MTAVPARRLLRASVFALGALLIGAPTVVVADLEPAQGSPGTRVVYDDACEPSWPGEDWLFFSDRRQPLNDEGDTAWVTDPVADAPLLPLGGTPGPRGGFVATASWFVVPRMPGGVYWMYVFCMEFGFVPAHFIDTFRVLGPPDTSMSAESAPREQELDWRAFLLLWVLGVGTLAGAAWARRRSAVASPR